MASRVPQVVGHGVHTRHMPSTRAIPFHSFPSLPPLEPLAHLTNPGCPTPQRDWGIRARRQGQTGEDEMAAVHVVSECRLLLEQVEARAHTSRTALTYNAAQLGLSAGGAPQFWAEPPPAE